MLRTYAAARAWRRANQPSIYEVGELLESVCLKIIREIATGVKRALKEEGTNTADVETNSIILARHN